MSVNTTHDFQRLEAEVHELREAIEGRQSHGARLWDIGIKLMVPFVLALCGAMIRNEVVDAVQQDRIVANSRSIQAMPPAWLQDQITEMRDTQIRLAQRLEAVLDALSERMTRLEAKLEKR